MTAEIVVPEVLSLTEEDARRVLERFSDEQLDDVIVLTDNAAMVNRLARIERGRRTDAYERKVLPGSTFDQTEKNRRSEERKVAEWFDANGEPVETVRDNGWKRLVVIARQTSREATPARQLVQAADLAGKSWEILVGDFRERTLEIADGTVDLILTDPPYPKEDLPLYYDLATAATRLLGDRGLLATYAGNMFIPEVLDLLRDGGLTYGWTMCLLMDEGSRSRIMGRHIMQTWKPVFIFTKGTWPSRPWMDDLVKGSGREKQLYEWQQNSNDAADLINRLCPPTGRVVDPFLGVGSFGVAAVTTGREFIGIEEDHARAASAQERIAAALA